MAAMAYNQTPILKPFLKEIVGSRAHARAADTRLFIIIPPKFAAFTNDHTHLCHPSVARLT